VCAAVPLASVALAAFLPSSRTAVRVAPKPVSL
jgi:hypothetical protein